MNAPRVHLDVTKCARIHWDHSSVVVKEDMNSIRTDEHVEVFTWLCD